MTTPNSPEPTDPNHPDGVRPGDTGQDGTEGQRPPEPRYGQYSQPQQPPAPPHAGQSGHTGQEPQPDQYNQSQYQPGQYQPGNESGQYNQPGQFGQPGPYGQNAAQYGQAPYGYQAAQPSGYAYPGGPTAQTGPKGPPPREVMLGFWLILAAGVLAFINNLVTSFNLPDLLTPSQIRDLRDANVDVQDVSGFLITVSVVIALIGLGLYVLIAWFVRKGHNWARIVGTVFAAFSVIGLLFSLPAYFTSPLGLLSLLSTLAGIAGIVMLYLKPSNAYFQRHQFNPYRPY